MPTIAVVGAGAMGSNHARVVAESPHARLGLVIDPDRRRAADLANRYGATPEADWRAARSCDAVVVASPTETHEEVALDLLGHGVSTLVEKPLAPTLEGARRIVDAAASSKGALMCGFVERFNPAFLTAMGLATERPLHIVGIRHSPAAPRIRTSVVHDLLIHDIDLVLQLAGDGNPVVEVGSATSDPLDRGTADVADCVLRFESGLIATLSASRASHRKIRSLAISDSERLIEVDLLRQNVDVYKHVRHELVGSGSYSAETVHDIPFVRRPGEPLTLQFEHFLRLVEDTRDRQVELDGLLPAHAVAAKLG